MLFRCVCVLLVASAAAAPLVARAADPTSVPAPELKPGDSWVFDRKTERGTSGFSDQRLDFRIERTGDGDDVVGVKLDGSPLDYEDHVIGADWSQRRVIDGEQTVIGRPLSFPLTIGKTWTVDYTDPARHGLQVSAEHHEVFKVVGWEDVTTPAGVFHALRIEDNGKVKANFLGSSSSIGGAVAGGGATTAVTHSAATGPHTVYGEFFSTFDYVPAVKYWVKSVEEDFNGENVRTVRRIDELISFKPAG